MPRLFTTGRVPALRKPTLAALKLEGATPFGSLHRYTRTYDSYPTKEGWASYGHLNVRYDREDWRYCVLNPEEPSTDGRAGSLILMAEYYDQTMETFRKKASKDDAAMFKAEHSAVAQLFADTATLIVETLKLEGIYQQAGEAETRAGVENGETSTTRKEEIASLHADITAALATAKTVVTSRKRALDAVEATLLLEASNGQLEKAATGKENLLDVRARTRAQSSVLAAKATGVIDSAETVIEAQKNTQRSIGT